MDLVTYFIRCELVFGKSLLTSHPPRSPTVLHLRTDTEEEEEATHELHKKREAATTIHCFIAASHIETEESISRIKFARNSHSPLSDLERETKASSTFLLSKILFSSLSHPLLTLFPQAGHQTIPLSPAAKTLPPAQDDAFRKTLINGERH